jgi:hypothetical protein
MATPGANNNDQLREARDLLQQLNALKRQLGETPLNLGEEDLLRIAQDLPNDIRRARRELEDIQGTASDLYSRLRGVTSEFKFQATTLGKVRGAFRQLEEAAQTLKLDEQGISDLNTSQLKKLQEKIVKSKELVRQEADSLISNNRLAQHLEQQVQQKRQAGKSEEEINDYVLNRLGNIRTLSSEEKALLQLHFDQRDAVTEINDKILERIEQEKEVNRLLGVGGATVGGISSLMGKLGMNSNIFSDAVSEAEEAMRETAKNIEAGTQSGGKLTVLMAGLGPLAKGFASALLDPTTMILAIVDGFLAVNAAAVDYTRLTGQSAVNTAGMNSSFASSVDVLKVMTELTTEIGMSAGAIFSNEDLGRLAEAKNLLGLSGEQATNLATRSKVAGKSIQDYEKGIVGATNKYNTTNKSVVAHGAVLQEVLSTSDEIALSLGGNPEKLAKAASAAMSLGLNLQRVDEIAGSLTDFQSSISDELEAELLTGKELNLEKAREYALTNNLTGLSEELAKNGASAAEFGKMNRLEQDALAKALGMSRAELAKSAQLELMRAGASKEAIEAAGDMTLEQLEQASIQDRIKVSLDKLAQSFAPILEALAPIAEMLGNVVQPIASVIAKMSSGISKVIGPLMTVFGIFKGIQLVNTGILAATTAIGTAQAFIAAAKTSELGLGLSILSVLGFQNAAEMYKLTLMTGGNTLAAIGAAIQQTTLYSILAQGAGIIKNTVILGAQLVVSLANAAAALTANAALTFGVGVAIAIGAALAGFAALKSMKDGEIGADGRPTLFTGTDTVKLDEKDSIYTAKDGSMKVGTDLLGEKNAGGAQPSLNPNTGNKETGGSQSISNAVADMSPVVTELAALRAETVAVLNRILAKEGTVYMDSNKVGRAQVLGSYKSS